MKRKRILIVGGVAGGASAAARARRLSEEAEILVFERGPHVSFANCGLPYFVSGEIRKSKDLVLQTPEELHARFNLDVRVNTEAVRIDRNENILEVRDLKTGEVAKEPYDALLLSPGASAIKPPIPGIDSPGHFTLRTVPDTLAISTWITIHQAKRAVVVGGGYIGMEITEQLTRRGLTVSVVEEMPQVVGIFDVEMATYLHRELLSNGTDLHLSDSVVAFDSPKQGEQAAASVVFLKSGARLPADIVILAIGVRPEVELARLAGLEIGELGGIRVDNRLRTSDPHIWAVGDAIEVRHIVTGEWALIALAGPANRQGRIAADNILGRDSCYEGTLGTSIVRLFDITAAATGANERMLGKVGIDYQSVHLHPNSHAGYYPGSSPIALKVLFAPESGKILGAQAVGRDGVDKRMDILATSIKAGMTVSDLAQLELSYAPPFGSAKDPVNLAGMIAENVIAGDLAQAQWDEVEHLDDNVTLLLDVRQPEEWDAGRIPGAVHIPLPELRNRLCELPLDREIVVYCQSGQRSYYACRILTQYGFRCRNLSGAYLTWSAARGR